MKRNLTLSDCIKIAGGSSNIANQTADNKTKAMTSSEVESIASKVSNSSVCQQALNASRTDWDINVREYILEATKRGLSVDKCRAIVSGNSLSSPSTGSNIIQNSSVITVHLTFCNRSSGTAFLAYGYGSASVRGWYPIKRDDCFLAGDLNKDDLYWYAVSENRKAWESKTDDYSWCVDLNNKFDTVRKKYCDVGEVRKSFNKIITDNSTFTMNLDEGPN
jgi:uncharacterized membrane protein